MPETIGTNATRAGKPRNSDTLADAQRVDAGPERIESGWWDGDDAKRDYFVARLPNASLAWVYREEGEWFLHGLFA